MWPFHAHSRVWIVYATSILWQYAGANPALSLRGCEGNPYCQTKDGHYRWHNDCGIERPSHELFEEHRGEDVPWLREHLSAYSEMGEPTETFMVYLAKRYAPDHAPSNMICDGINACIAPSCKDLAKDMTYEEKRQMLLWFDFTSVLNAGHHSVSEALQDFFIEQSFDLEYTTKTFSYSDDLQDLAKVRKQKRETTLAIISGLLLATSALTGTASMWGTPITSGVSRAIARNPASKLGHVANRASKGIQKGGKKLRLPGKDGKYGQGMDEQINNINGAVGGILTGGFIGVTNLMKEYSNIKHKDDTEGWDKFLPEISHTLAGISRQTMDVIAKEMMDLAFGRKNSEGKDLIDLYESGFYSEPNVNLRGHIKHTVRKMFTAKYIGVLWQSEGTTITGSLVMPGYTCDQDNRSGDTLNRVCLEERPEHVYYVNAVTHYSNNSLRYPPGLERIAGGNDFNGVTMDGMFRSSAFDEEVWQSFFMDDGSPGVQTILQESTLRVPGAPKRATAGNYMDTRSFYVDQKAENGMRVARSDNRRIQLLDHYGDIPGAVSLPICYSTFGEAISAIDSGHNSNAPCLCDPAAPYLGRRWDNPSNWTLAATDLFIAKSELYLMKEFGQMCRKHNDCEKDGKWVDRLDLGPDQKPVKEMEDAWTKCKHPRGHPKPEQPPGAKPSEVKPPVPVNTLEPVSISVFYPDTQTKPSVTTDYYRNADGSIKTSVRIIAPAVVTTWVPNPKLQPHLETQTWSNEDTTTVITTTVTPAPQPSM